MTKLFAITTVSSDSSHSRAHSLTKIRQPLPENRQRRTWMLIQSIKVRSLQHLQRLPGHKVARHLSEVGGGVVSVLCFRRMSGG